MTPFEIFATNGHLRGPAASDRRAANDASLDNLVARRAYASVNTVERWVRFVFPGRNRAA